MQYIKFLYDDMTLWGRLEGGIIHVQTGFMGVPAGEKIPLSEVTLLAPCEPTKIVCVGKNYARHVKEMGGSETDLPKEPGIFLKGLNALSNPGDPIAYPSWTKELHYEGELALVMGKRAKHISEDEALSYIFGYTCACDVTARDKQKSDLQWTRGKSSDGFCPVGPWIETDLDPGNVGLQTRLNGELRQDGHTRDLIFSIPKILSYVSSFMTLEPGDLVLTGTPDGVGPMQVGDIVEVTVEGIGTLGNNIELESGKV
jgi:2-keto-4-pentenoate hydratase/2-oxohepta-3-ene-1,7-dioic acid hydratase in catechol pathway